MVVPHPDDPDPSPILGNFSGSLSHPARVAYPAVRRGWLERGPGPDEARGRDEFVQVSWDKAIELVAGEVARVKARSGPQGIFGGSYGWSSAGRFHHAQSQVHRFLNVAAGGYVRSVNSYSAGASAVVIPHIIGNYDQIVRQNITWDQIVGHTDIVLSFGGMALKNSMVAAGGNSRHIERSSMLAAAERGCEFVLFGPLKDDLPEEAAARWIPVVPGTDTALMLAMVHTLVRNGLHDREFLDRYCVGWDRFEPYVMGLSDGCAKDAAWASRITGVPEQVIKDIALSLPGKRVLVTVSHSLQRSEHGEQPVWMGVVLGAVLGQIGLPGGGYAYAIGALGHYGKRMNMVPSPSLPQGTNGIRDFIPVARIADMLLDPGGQFRYNGATYAYPHVSLVYWAGGNPFHHHQDINRLRRAFARPDTIVVHEIAWTATARHADIVLPCTMSLEREDIGALPTDPLVVAMHRLADAYGEARNDFDIFTDLAERMGCREAFTEGRTSGQWLRHLYAQMKANAEDKGIDLPDFDGFWEAGEVLLPQQADSGGAFRAFRDDPQANPLKTPSGKIEIFSETIHSFAEPDCPGHPAWLEPSESPSDAFPLILVANQPATRLHSQLDFGSYSVSRKRASREVMRINPLDARVRGIADGDLVILSSPRGECLASTEISEGVAPGVVQLPTGAWYDPDDLKSERALCVHGNPNVLTRDIGTSSLAQGCSGQLCAVQVQPFVKNAPPVRAFDPPPMGRSR